MKKFLKSFAESSAKTQLFTIVMTLFFLFYCACNVQAETRREDNNFVQISAGSRSDTVVTMCTYQIGDIKYPITINRKTTRCWIWKEGNKTKTYLPEEVERGVCEKMGITYIPKKKRSK